jgi:hypothetical protein
MYCTLYYMLSTAYCKLQLQQVEDEMPFEFSLPEPGAIGTPVLGVEAVSFGYDAVHGLLFQNVHFGVDMESRIGQCNRHYSNCQLK